MRRPKLCRYAPIGLALAAAIGLTRSAAAQHTPDPYNIVGEYNVGYENFMYPTYGNAAGFTSNQGILQGRAGVGRANQFQSYLDSVLGFGGSSDDGLFGTSRRGGGYNQPYYLAHRQFDEAFDRIYTPNAGPDQNFRAEQEKRTKLYIDYLKEPDPKKRAQLFRAYMQLSLRAARDAGAGAARAGTRPRPAPRSTLPPAPPGPDASVIRRPAGNPALDRPRGTSPAPRRSETPEEILDRASRSAAPRGDRPAPPGSPTAPR
jgi:hypothetical protein